MSEVSDYLAAAALARARRLQAARKAFISVRSTAIREATPLYFFVGSCDFPVDRALVDKALKLFIRTQTQHFFAATSCISLPQIEEHSFEQGLEFERGLRRKHSDQLLGNAVWRPTCKRESRSFRHLRLSHGSVK